ncbi:hypothetical protein BAE44_0016947 [Dichanthelium oligosanthes]|uniref:Uncharacterized protein n=1 Tax=Dichanthelium oligosanthes TaxID=888268 RepID=A0A1E5VA44_9POAL|nr:hypothetical protein BAE44_0016947 [Dichanthelium oligosanthes]
MGPVGGRDPRPAARPPRVARPSTPSRRPQRPSTPRASASAGSAPPPTSRRRPPLATPARSLPVLPRCCPLIPPRRHQHHTLWGTARPGGAKRASSSGPHGLRGGDWRRQRRGSRRRLCAWRRW